ncbi:hypothetical protein AUK22_06130 [bacterium CG2_30_54_10]|nr:MAG: hypothetical protein AUK22_06130 [bacterium CG2_30_54_10]
MKVTMGPFEKAKDSRQEGLAFSVVLLVIVLARPWFSATQGMSEINGKSADPIAVWREIASATVSPELRLVPASHPPCMFEGVDESGKVKWYAIFTSTMWDRTYGYVGPIDLMIGVDEKNRITAVRVLGHHETPSFVQGIDEPWFLDQFIGKGIEDPIEPGIDFDGITRATITTKAIAADIRSGIRLLAGAPAGSSSSVAPSKSMHWNIWCLAGAVAISLLGIRLPRPFSSVAIVGLLGVATQQFLSMAHLQMLLRSPSAAFYLPSALMVFLAVAGSFAIVKPRGYCVCLCPMGRVQDLLTALIQTSAPADPVAQTSLPADPVVYPIGRVICWSGLIALGFSAAPPLEKLEVFTPLFLNGGGPLGILLVFAALTGAVVLPRFYCRALCPLNPLFEDLETAKGFWKKPHPLGRNTEDDNEPPTTPA